MGEIEREVTVIPRTKTKLQPDATAPQTMLALIGKGLEDGKAEEIVTLDLRGKTSIADHMVIASGRSQRQVIALADHLVQALKAAGVRRVSVEGLPHGEWVLIDAGDVLVQIFRPEVRSYYNLEKMWGAALGEAVGSSA